MVRVLNRNVLPEDSTYVEMAGLSTDTKPLIYCTGSLFLEVDTGDIYAFDEDGGEWDKIAELGGDGT